MSTSRERFLQQLERCVQHQRQDIEPGPVLIGESEQYNMGEFIAEDAMGNGEQMQCDASAIWGLRPPGEETPPSPIYTVGDWA